MLSSLTRRFRLRAAVTFAALYAFCVLLPPAALALTYAAAHCLADQGPAHVHGKTAVTPHTHADGADHDDGPTQEHSDATGKAMPGNCCGLFCVAALSHEPGFALLAPPPTVRTVPAIAESLDGRGPDRLKRPPRT